MTDAIVLISFDSADDMAPILPELAEWIDEDPSNREVAIVDNFHSSESSAAVRQAVAPYPGLTCYFEPRNRGFAPAVNLALDRLSSTCTKVLLLNPDVDTDRRTIERVFAALDHAGGVAPLLVNEDSYIDGGSIRRDWNLRRLFVEVAGFPRWARWLGTQTYRQYAAPAASFDVACTSGAFLATHREILGSKGLDTRIPMYFEDQELCWRIRESGRRLIVLGDVQAVHRGGSSRKKVVGPSSKKLRLMELAESRFLALTALQGRSSGPVRMAMALGAMIRMVAALCLSPLRPGWSIEQLRLAAWMFQWSIHPRFSEMH